MILLVILLLKQTSAVPCSVTYTDNEAPVEHQNDAGVCQPASTCERVGFFFVRKETVAHLSVCPATTDGCCLRPFHCTEGDDWGFCTHTDHCAKLKGTTIPDKCVGPAEYKCCMPLENNLGRGLTVTYTRLRPSVATDPSRWRAEAPPDCLFHASTRFFYNSPPTTDSSTTVSVAKLDSTLFLRFEVNNGVFSESNAAGVPKADAIDVFYGDTARHFRITKSKLPELQFYKVKGLAATKIDGMIVEDNQREWRAYVRVTEFAANKIMFSTYTDFQTHATGYYDSLYSQVRFDDFNEDANVQSFSPLISSIFFDSCPLGPANPPVTPMPVPGNGAQPTPSPTDDPIDNNPTANPNNNPPDKNSPVDDMDSNMDSNSAPANMEPGNSFIVPIVAAAVACCILMMLLCVAIVFFTLTKKRKQGSSAHASHISMHETQPPHTAEYPTSEQHITGASSYDVVPSYDSVPPLYDTVPINS